MTDFALEFLPLLCLAFASGCLAFLIYFLLGSPESGTFKGEVDESMILGFLGVILLRAYGNYHRSHPTRKFNPWKLFTCIFCLGQWVGILQFIFAMIFFGFSWELLLINQALTHFWIGILNRD